MYVRTANIGRSPSTRTDCAACRSDRTFADMDLAELIRSHKGDRSFKELQRACGDYPSDKRLQQLATKPPRNFPDPPTISALARGLRVPAVTVVLSAAESLGIDVRRAAPALLDRLPAGVDKLTEEQTRVLVDMARSFVESNETSVAQRVALRNLLAHSDVDIFDENDAPVTDAAGLDRVIDSLLADERQSPGTLANFMEAMQAAREHIREVEERGESHANIAFFTRPEEPSDPDEILEHLREEQSAANPERRDPGTGEEHPT